jgi:hypothetical protein
MDSQWNHAGTVPTPLSFNLCLLHKRADYEREDKLEGELRNIREKGDVSTPQKH